MSVDIFEKFANRIKSPIPINTRKGELYEILHKQAGWSIRSVRKEIRETIVKLRLVSKKEAKDCKDVYPNELEAILNRFKIGI